MIEVTIIIAFLAGLLSFFSPCILPVVVPVYVGLFAGSDETKTKKTAINSLLFVAGFTVVFVTLGALAGFFGFFALRELSWLMKVAGIIVLFFGAQMILSALNIKWTYKIFGFLERDKRFHPSAKGARGLKFFLLGLAFGFGWAPCIGPVLGSILILAYSSQTALQGAGLLAVYSAGLGVPFVASALFANYASKLIGRMKRFFRAVKIISGLLLIALGLLIATDNMIFINAWFYGLFS